MRLSGWHRIVVVISVAWVLALSGFIRYEYENSDPFCESRIRDGLQCQHAFWWYLYDKSEKESDWPYTLTLRHRKAVVVAVVPLATLWFCFGAVLWVKRGFREKP